MSIRSQRFIAARHRGSAKPSGRVACSPKRMKPVVAGRAASNVTSLVFPPASQVGSDAAIACRRRWG